MDIKREVTKTVNWKRDVGPRFNKCYQIGPYFQSDKIVVKS